MNWEHLKTFIWLRYRLRRNQFRRAGTLNAVLQILLSILGIVSGLGLFATFFLVAIFAFPKVPPYVLMFTWAGLIVAFLFSWIIGLLTELQRSEVLSLGKFLHLPVSLSGAFLINYLSTFASLTLLIFLPAMLGLALGLVFARGPIMLLLLPLLAAFILMVTALTYQLQGWLATLMTNPRRRRTVVVVATMTIVLVAQTPNLVHLFVHKGEKPRGNEKGNRENEGLKAEFAAGRITQEQFQKQQAENESERKARLAAENEEIKEQFVRYSRFICAILPPGWLALGAEGLARESSTYAVLGIVGLTLIGGGSLYRSYRTTLRLYTGDFNAQKGTALAPAPAKTRATKVSVRFLERQLPWISEHASAITFTSFRSLIRAPEAKMMLLAPIIMVLVFGGVFMRQSGVRSQIPELVRPLIALGMMAAILLSMIQIIGNQFGFDRSGFRVLVLCPAQRRDILLGKNLAMLPIAICLGLMTVVGVQVVLPMRWDYFLSAFPETLSIYLLFCLLANCLSIMAPLYIAPGSMRPSNVKVIPVLLQLASMALLPVIMALCLLPLGAQAVLQEFGMIEDLPIGLALALLECVAIIYVYYLTLSLQGRWLQARELRILEIVTAKQE